MQKLTKGFGIIGLILIVFAIIAVAITKLANWYFYTHLGLGVLFILSYVFFNFDTFLTRLRERSTTEGGKVFVYTGIVILIIVTVNVVSFRKSSRYDATENKVYTLEDQTHKVLKNLKAPIKLTGFFHSKNQQKDAFKELVETYIRLTSKLSYVILDPDKNPDIANRLQIKDGDVRLVYGSPDLLLATFDDAKIREALKDRVSGIYIFAEQPNSPNYLKVKELLAAPEFVSKGIMLELLNPSAPTPANVDVKNPQSGNILIQFAQKDTVMREISEQALTNAIMQVGRQVTPVVRFTTSHSERSLGDEEENGLSTLKGAIQNEGYDVSAIDSTLVSGVPSGTDILVIAGPVSPFTAEEADSVNRYLEEGGKVILMADPNFSNPKLNPMVTIIPTGLETLAEKWGVTIDLSIILEQHNTLIAGQTTDPYVVTQNYAVHEIMAPLKDASTFFTVVRPVRRSDKATPDLNVIEIIKTAQSSVSWGETDLTSLIVKRQATQDAKDQRGPVSLAVVSERDKTVGEKSINSKLVVFGDSDFVNNRQIRSQEFNYDLFLNALNWMWGKQEQISIRPKQIRSSKLLLTPEQTNIIFYAAVLTIPELVLIIGLVIYWRRKSR